MSFERWGSVLLQWVEEEGGGRGRGRDGVEVGGDCGLLEVRVSGGKRHDRGEEGCGGGGGGKGKWGRKDGK